MSKSVAHQNCCSAIQEAIGLFFLRCGQIVDGQTLNNSLPGEELIQRTQLLEVFILAVNAKVRSTFAELTKCVKCKGDSCCEASANAIGNVAIGFVHFAYQATLSLGNPLVAISTGVRLDPCRFECIPRISLGRSMSSPRS